MQLRLRIRPLPVATLFNSGGINWDLRILGKTVDAAPLTDPYPADNGAGERGSLTVVETDGSFAADGTKIDVTAQGTPAWGDQYMRDSVGRTRERGRIAAGRVIVDDVTKSFLAGLWNKTVIDNAGLQGIYTVSSGLYVFDIDGSSIDLGIGLTNDDQVDWMTIARATGTYHFVSINGGNWQLLWWHDTDSTTPVYAGASYNNAAGSMNLLGSVVVPESLVPSPIVSDNSSLIPTIEDSGANGLDATASRIGLNKEAAHFNNVNSYISMLPSALIAAGYDSSLGGMIVQAQVANSDMWTDGLRHYFCTLFGAGLNEQAISIHPTDNQIEYIYRADGVNYIVNKTSISDTGSMVVAISWSDFSNDARFRAFYNGIQEGSDVAIGEVFVDPIISATIGATSTGGASRWAGNIKNYILWLGFEPTPANISTVSTKLAADTLTVADLSAIAPNDKWIWYQFNEQYVTDGFGHLEADGNGSGKTRDGPPWSSEGNKRYNGAVGGVDLVINGGFDTDTDWNRGTGWTIAAGVAHCDGTQVAATNLNPSVNMLTTGRFAKLVLTLSNNTAGNAKPHVGSINAPKDISGNATYTAIRRATSPTIFIQGDADFISDVDDVSSNMYDIADLLDLTDSGQAEHYFASNATIIDLQIGGGGVAWDAAKANGILAYYDRNTDEVIAEKWLSGVFDSEVIRVAATYSAGATPKVSFTDIDGDSTYNLTVWYDDTFIATVTVSDAAIVGNTHQGEFGFLEGGFAEKGIVMKGNEGRLYHPHFAGVT